MEPETLNSRDRREYQRKRRQQAVILYFPCTTELERYQALALAGGYTQFNPWLIQMLAQATNGSVYPPEYVENLKEELDKARGWLETARDETIEYRKEVKALREQRDRLALALSEFPTGAELATRVLTDSVNYQGVRA